MASKPQRLRNEVAAFCSRLQKLRRDLRNDLKNGGWGVRAELLLVTALHGLLRVAAFCTGRILDAVALTLRVMRSLSASQRIATVSELPTKSQAVLIAENGTAPRTPCTFAALLCNFNHAAFIEQTITSVVGQSRRPDEYLILDDGSSDDSIEIISRYAEKYPFIKVIRKAHNEGLTKGMNELIQLAKSDFIHFGSADDYMLPGFIENAMRLAEQNPRVGIITGIMAIESEATGAVQHLGIPNWKTGFIAPEKYLHEYLETGDPTCVLSASTILRRDAVIEMGSWRENLGIWHVSFAIQACALKYGMCYLDMPCYTWVYRRKGLTHRANVDVPESIAVYTNYLELICSPEFRSYFSEKFARMWFTANVEMTARTFAVERAEEAVEKGRHNAAATQLRPAA